ncbi:XdhC family protein [Marinoscillum furvescens]|uniref:Xanthine/CO dehydrogenase XdhC/CoxF family maturation factor n=1 Tax=Marinoscillum furvescens DSM 4134 TaxID=1122208 RepID=A0A3D9KZC4_MARFU|nr:XdhC/CoxI family protein [Marinoscillum furvescens]RED92208.1 hypothetical protein C7460_13220 [Marinoscillum furvescens DSM 4134]
MKEIKEIIAAYDRATSRNMRCVLATVVHVEGSSYRGAGARMLVDEYGQMTGAISGGCLEGDALQKALHALAQNRTKLVTYDTGDEADAIVGAQLGCDGVIQVLFEPLEASNSQVIELLRVVTSDRETRAVVTFFDLDKSGGQHLGTVALATGNELHGQLPDEQLRRQLQRDMELTKNNKCSLFRKYQLQNQSIYAFIELFEAPRQLVIVGAGNDARVLAQLAEPLGWELTVVDGRPSHASKDRFVSSCQVLVSRPEAVLENIPVDDQTAFVLITHNYHYDLAVLQQLLMATEVPYIGLLGPKKKFLRMQDELNASGVAIAKDAWERVYAPVGLEIGAETPAEIGLSILAEVQAAFAQKPGGYLRDKKGTIHSQRNKQFETIDLR